MMGWLNRQNKEMKKNKEETERETIAMNVLVERERLEELKAWAEMGKKTGIIQQYYEKAQQENYRLQAEIKHYQEFIKQQEKLIQEVYGLRKELSQYRERERQQEKAQQEISRLQKDNENYRKKIEQEQELRKQCEFKLEVATRELKEEAEKLGEQSAASQSIQKQPQPSGMKDISGAGDNKKEIQRELTECSKAIREMQHVIKEAYQFEPCRQLCELLVNIRQKVYSEMESIQEDMGCVIESFGVKEYDAVPGNIFDPKYHEQVYSSMTDVKGKKIKEVFSPGFEMDGEIIMKAQVSIEESKTGGTND